MNHNFKIGDTVIYIGSYTDYTVKATVGMKYKVVDASFNRIYIKMSNYPQMAFYSCDFKKVENKIKLYEYLLNNN